MVPDWRLEGWGHLELNISMMFVVTEGPILKVSSRLDMIWLRKPNLVLGGC